MSDTKEKQEIAPVEFTPAQVELLKRTVARGATDDELKLFAMICRRTGLDPFLRQIHAVKRWDRDAGKEVLVTQVGIDGLRLIADRTQAYAPGRESSFTYGEDGSLVSATAYVKKLTSDGTWHEVAATARLDEYAQTRKDGSRTAFWLRMSHSMLAKCAESAALRRSFPAETSGIYTHEEMQQAEPAPEPAPSDPPMIEFKGARFQCGGITQATFEKVTAACRQIGKERAANLLGQFGVESVLELNEPHGVEYLAVLREIIAVEGPRAAANGD